MDFKAETMMFIPVAVLCFFGAVSQGLTLENDSSAPPSSLYPEFSWDTVPLFWHAYEPNGPFNESELDFILRFPLVTIEKGQSIRQAPVSQDAEDKIVAAARQVKSRKASVKVLMYTNAVIDWWMYKLHVYCQQHQTMWLHNEMGKPVLIFNQTVFDVRPEENRRVWIADLLAADRSGYIDGAFVDRGLFETNIKTDNITEETLREYLLAHDKHMLEIQEAMGPNKIIISNNKDYDGVTARMFERFFLSDYDGNKPYADLLALSNEGQQGRIAEAHGEPCTPDVLNITLAGFLLGAEKYAYYGCTSGWTVSRGWLQWHAEYSKPLGAPKGPAKTIASAVGYCRNDTIRSQRHIRSEFWENLKEHAKAVQYKRHHIVSWIRRYKEKHPEEPSPILAREFESGTCVTLDFNTNPLTACVAWADGSVTGSTECIKH